MKLLAASLLSLGLFTTAALADAGKPGKVFTPDEAKVITETLGILLGTETSADDGGKGKKAGKGAKNGLPPGLAKKEALPPGLQKQLERGGTLPPGLAKRSLPADLRARLGPPAAGTERLIAGTDVVLVEKATGVVLDILRDAARAK